MRVLILALALLAAACSKDEMTSSGGHGGYTLEVRASDAEQLYLITAPDGRVTGARTDKTHSMLLDASTLHGLMTPAVATTSTATTTGTSTSTTANSDNNVSIHGPGFSLDASGDGDTDSKDGDGQAHLNMNFNGHGIQIDANGHDGGANNRAHVLITGADEETARGFINDADDLSGDVKTQMRAAVGL